MIPAIDDINEFIKEQTPRLYEKLGKKIGKGELPFTKNKIGADEAIKAVKETLENASETTTLIPKNTVRGDYDLLHIYSSVSGYTVSLRVLESGQYEHVDCRKIIKVLTNERPYRKKNFRDVRDVVSDE